MFRKCCSLQKSGDDIKILKLYLRISQEQKSSTNISCCSVPDHISSCFVRKFLLQNEHNDNSTRYLIRMRLTLSLTLKEERNKKSRRTRYWISYSIWSCFCEVWSDEPLEKITNLWFFLVCISHNTIWKIYVGHLVGKTGITNVQRVFSSVFPS